MSEVQFQPIASDDVAAFVADAVLMPAVNGIVEIAGPERFTLREIVARYLQDTNDPRKVVANSNDNYYGGTIPNAALVPADNSKAKLGAVNYEKWLQKQAQKA
jgi:uncharacterized protein YbjT (DUF2867 family)